MSEIKSLSFAQQKLCCVPGYYWLRVCVCVCVYSLCVDSLPVQQKKIRVVNVLNFPVRLFTFLSFIHLLYFSNIFIENIIVYVELR